MIENCYMHSEKMFRMWSSWKIDFTEQVEYILNASSKYSARVYVSHASMQELRSQQLESWTNWKINSSF